MAFFDASGVELPINVTDLQDNGDDKRVKINAARYILNYFEFMAVGIRYGDLDKNLLKDSMRGILLHACSISKELIKQRQVTNPKAYENLEWLKNKWSKK